MSKQERVYFQAAKAVSELSDHKHHLGCVIVDKHHIIGSGHNSWSKCHGKQAQLDMKYFNCPSQGPVHAEFDALLPLMNHRYDLRFATLYVYREHKNGQPAMARPCERCMEIIRRCGIRKIKYSTDGGYATEKLFY